MHPSLSKRNEKILYWILLGILACGMVAFLVMKYTDYSIELPMCVLLRLTGLYCPGCGGTRAFLLLLQGRFLASVYYHPVVFYGAVVAIWYLISHTIEYISKGRWAIGMRYRDIYLYAALVLILINWIVKNLFYIIDGIRLM